MAPCTEERVPLRNSEFAFVLMICSPIVRDRPRLNSTQNLSGGARPSRISVPLWCHRALPPRVYQQPRLDSGQIPAPARQRSGINSCGLTDFPSVRHQSPKENEHETCARHNCNRVVRHGGSPRRTTKPIETTRTPYCTVAMLKGRYLFGGIATLVTPASEGQALPAVAGYHVFNGDGTGKTSSPRASTVKA